MSSAANEPTNDNQSFGMDARQPTAEPGMGSRQVTTDTGGMDSRQVTNASMDPEMLAELERLSRPLYVPAPEVTTNHESEANFLSRLFLFFLQDTLNKAVELDDVMEVEHLDPMIGEDRADRCFQHFRDVWKKELEEHPTEPSLFRVMFACLRFYAWSNVFWVALETSGPFISVVLMKYVNEFVVDKSLPMSRGGLLACCFFIANVLTTIGAAQSSRNLARVGARIGSYLQMECMRKTIQLTPAGSQSLGQGMLFQTFNGDCSRVAMMLPNIFRSMDCIYQVVGAFIYLGFVAGWPACGAVGVFIVALPLNYQISSSFIVLYIQKMMAGDRRTKKVIEMINSVRVVKFFGWEKPFLNLVNKLREPELQTISALMGRLAVLMCSFGLATPVMQLVLFILITVKDNSVFSVLTFFQSMSLVGIISLTMIRLPFTYSILLQCEVSFERLVKVFTAEERPDGEHVLPPAEKIGDIVLENVDARYALEAPSSEAEAASATFPSPPASPSAAGGSPKKNPASLKLIVPSFHARAGELVVVVGKVGSGKSTLINALLGDMHLAQGTVKRSGKVAYVPQNAWILNATVRNNIIMDNPYDREWYDRVIDAVDLRPDLTALPNGDLTEVGEKGINLSGGQRQRLSLARALYSKSDILLFDDPLSALDAQVGRHVFNAAINGLLRDATRVLVTHQMSYLPQATRVYLANNLTITEEAIPTEEAIAQPATPDESPLISMMRAWSETARAQDKSPSPSPTAGGRTALEGPAAVKKKKGEKKEAKLTVREERQSGRVEADTLWLYLKSFGSFGFWIPLFLLHLIVVCCNIFGQLWMGFWTGFKFPSLNAEHPPVFFLGIYGAAIGLAAIIVFFRELLWRVGAVNAPRRIYALMTDSVLHAPMAFYDTTPVGRIINRFTKDAEQLDFTVPMAANQTLSLFFTQIGSMIAMCYFLPYFSPVVAVAILCLLFVQPSVATVVLRRLASSTAGPVAALYSEALSGASSIRTLGLTEFFNLRFAQRMDEMNAARFADFLLFECIRVRINIISALFSAAMMLIIMAMRDTLAPYDASFLVSNGIQVTLYMGYMMFQRGNLMLSLNSMERLNEYCRLTPEVEGHHVPDENWPVSGTVELRNVTAQYRPGLPMVLNDVSLTIRSGEKIGICGRTGSGKSSFILTLFRLVPILGDSAVLIDGVDISSMPLASLRSKVSAIPQEPTLFAGTVAENLDPFQSLSRDTLLHALEVCHLSGPLETLRESKSTEKAPIRDVLDLPVGEGDMSVGQKQLLCLARAVARGLKILVLDEATSSVDAHTDQLIQRTIRESFAHCTVITIAHRLNTIMDCDRVLVMQAGRVAEFDAPSTLLRNEDSLFSALVREAEEHENE